jgi:hypothetical protein
MWLCLLQVVSLSEDNMPVDWNSDRIQKWMDSGKEEQQGYCDSPHIVNGREYEISDTSNLKKIIGSALFEDSEKEQVENFTDEQRKHISKVSDSIKKSVKKHEVKYIRLYVLYVLVMAADGCMKLPVIKLLKPDINTQQDNNIFIDFSGRVYKNWKDYLKNNTLPSCILCYPKNGVYSVVNGVVEVEYGTSPAGKKLRKFLRRLDFGFTALGLGATLVGTAALCFPVALPVVAG